MPSDYLKSLVKRGVGSLQKLEGIWDRATDAARDQGKGKNFAYITKIFQNMLGIESTASEHEVGFFTKDEARQALFEVSKTFPNGDYEGFVFGGFVRFLIGEQEFSAISLDGNTIDVDAQERPDVVHIEDGIFTSDTLGPVFPLQPYKKEPAVSGIRIIESVYLTRNDALDDDYIRRKLSRFNRSNTEQAGVEVTGFEVRIAQQDGKVYYILFDNFDKNVAVAFLEAQPMKIVGGVTAVQVVDYGVIEARSRKALVLNSFRGILQDKIVVSNGTLSPAGLHLFKRLATLGKYEFFLVSSRNKVVASVGFENGDFVVNSDTKSSRIYNSWNVLAVVAKSNRKDLEKLQSLLPN